VVSRHASTSMLDDSDGEWYDDDSHVSVLCSASKKFTIEHAAGDKVRTQWTRDVRITMESLAKTDISRHLREWCEAGGYRLDYQKLDDLPTFDRGRYECFGLGIPCRTRESWVQCVGVNVYSLSDRKYDISRVAPPRRDAARKALTTLADGPNVDDGSDVPWEEAQVRPTWLVLVLIPLLLGVLKSRNRTPDMASTEEATMLKWGKALYSQYMRMGTDENK